MARNKAVYRKVMQAFWTSPVARLCRKDPAMFGTVMHLLTSKHSNHIGLYQLPVMYLAHETGRGSEGAWKDLLSLSEVGFCKYDEATETVWVCEMAKYQVGEDLSPKDNQTVGVWNALAEYKHSAHFGPFWERYRHDFRLDESPLQAPSKPLASPFEAREQRTENKNTNRDRAREGGKPQGQPPHRAQVTVTLGDITASLVSSYKLNPTGPVEKAREAFTAYEQECAKARKVAPKWSIPHIAEPFLRLAAFCELHGGDPEQLLKVAVRSEFRMWGNRDVLTEPGCLLPESKLGTFQALATPAQKNRDPMKATAPDGQPEHLDWTADRPPRLKGRRSGRFYDVETRELLPEVAA